MNRERIAEIREFVREEVRRIAQVEDRPAAEVERFVLLLGLRHYQPGAFGDLLGRVPEKILEGAARFEESGAAASERGEGRVLEFAPRAQ